MIRNYQYLRQAGYRIPSIEAEHTTAVDEHPTHHQVIFDCLLVAKALVEPMRLMTHDASVALCSNTIIYA